MHIELKPELWNCLSAVQKRVVAESIDVKSTPRSVDVSELAAWVLTLAAAGVVFGFASLLMHLS
jgi:hypothetical protein